ncbi:hypothetical protein ERJ75_000336300 [Trypanosoma vivax]|nr:hypothetical protein ERJ75_000336300 [Trypanosoma vivax]
MEEPWLAAAAFRGTEEYAAVFDMEVWKAQQQAKLRSELSEEKARLQRKMAEDARRKEAQRMDELEALQQELQQLARRLQLREEALEKRISQFEAREAVFEDRRVKVAEQHEQHLQLLESRSRRQRDEAAVQIDILKTKLAERDRTVALLEEKLRASQNEYDQLQRYIASSMAAEEDKCKISRLEEELSSANDVMGKMQLGLKECDTELELLRKERDQLQNASKLYKDQLHQLARRYGELQSQWHQRERAVLEAERHQLEKAKRQQQLVSGGGPWTGGGEVHRYDVLGSLTAGRLTEPSAKCATSMHAGGYAADSLLSELKRDVEEGLNKLCSTRKKKGATMSAECGVVCAEVLPDHKVDSHPQGRRSDTKVASPSSFAGANAASSFGCARADASLERSQVPYNCNAFRYEDAQPNSSPVRKEDDAVSKQVAEGLEDLLDLSSNYGYADVGSWVSDEEGHRGVPAPMSLTEAHGSLPPLVPVRETDVGTGGEPEQQSRPAGLAQTPHTDAPHTTQESTRSEMMAFVAKLQANRAKLLESGVYSADDTIVKEMTDKIALYEDFVSRYF